MESGHYWVKTKEYGWDIAWLNQNGTFWLSSFECEGLSEAELEEIDERQIVRGE